MFSCSGSPPIRLCFDLCCEKFRELPKTGKPTQQQWTVLAGVLQHDTVQNKTKVVAIGCGTNCIGPSKMCSNGLILNDSHAEVLARRAFVRYLQNELAKATTNLQKQTSIFRWDNDHKRGFKIDKNIEFHFLSTQTPCGDACIVDEQQKPAIKRPRLEKEKFLKLNCGDVIYTGAKLIDTPNGVDAMEQKCGPVRTKPGRGERTLSMSCSDKLAKWNVLGVQGALLDILLNEPIYFKTLNICCQSAKESALRRAICDRWQHREFNDKRFIAQKPEIRINNELHFEFAQHSDMDPSPNGLAWCDLPAEAKPYEVSVNGKRQGVTKQNLNSPQAALAVSKYKLLANFVTLLGANEELRKMAKIDYNRLGDLTYAEYKRLSIDYQAAWTLIKSKYIRQWSEKPGELIEFSIQYTQNQHPVEALRNDENSYCVI